MLHIRLRRIGKKKQPIYRMIICEKTKDPWGDYLENLGTYNPRMNPSAINLKADRIKDWIGKGAQCSDTVWNILVDQKIVEGDKRKSIAISKKRKGKLDAKNAEKKAAEEAKKEAEAAKKAEEGAAKQAEAEAKAAEAEAPVEEAPKEEAPAEEAPKEESPSAESPSANASGDMATGDEEKPAEEAAPAEAPEEAPAEEEKPAE